MEPVNSSFTAWPASNRKVQRVCPSGGALQATATRACPVLDTGWASCFPSSLRRCPGRGRSLRALSNPPSTKRCRTRPTVAGPTIRASATCRSTRPSSAIDQQMLSRTGSRRGRGQRGCKVLSVYDRHQPVAQLRRSPLRGAQRSLTMLTLIVLSSSIHVSLTRAQHGIDDPGQLVRRGRDGRGSLPSATSCGGGRRPGRCWSGVVHWRPAAVPLPPGWRSPWSGS